MKYRIFAFLVLSVLVLNLGGSTFADSKRKKGGANELVAMLPASDGVVTFDVKRFFRDALPQLLSGNQPMLAKITGKIDELQTKIGIDVRQFDELVVGVSARPIAGKNYDVDPVVIGRGQMSSAALIGAAKLASTKYREERVGERVMYVFLEQVIIHPPRSTVGSLTEVAIAAIDEKVVAFGESSRVRQTLEAKTKVGLDITSLLGGNPNSVTSFAAKVPAGMRSFLPLENDELGKNIDAIQYIYGNADVAANSARIHMAVRTLQNAQAKSLHETLGGLQMLGKAFLGNAKGADKQVFARMIENVKFSVTANEVMLDLQMPQSDIDILVGKLK